GKYEEAMPRYRELLKMAIKVKSEKDIIIGHTNIGILLIERDSIPKGIVHLKQALDLAYKANNKAYVAAIKNNIGLAYRRKKEFELAKKYYEEAIQISRDQKLSHIEASALNSLAKISLAQDNFKAVQSYAKEALQLAEANKSLQWQADSWQLLSEVYELQHNPQALSAYKNYIALRDSILSTDKRLNFAQKEMQFQLASQQQINDEKLKRYQVIRNSIIAGSSGLLFMTALGYVLYKRKRDAHEQQKISEFNTIVAETELKALRAQMNPHFIFNSLNAIRNYIATKDTKTADEYLMKFARLTRAILENSEKKWISLQEDIELLELYMDAEKLRLNNQFSYTITISKEIDQNNVLIPPLMIQPFVENSIWHGFKDSLTYGEITIKVHTNEEFVILTVDDNGVGRQTIAVEQKKSMGLKITKTRLDIISRLKNLPGELNITDKTNGTQVELKLPLITKF
ncbi:MAG: histidine kinase, partial [Leeuwenhoekiella sp.]